jgi:ectoine hydroxylase-related dioxygenase (phytanoyl-CoA dioxygenase family)
MAQRVLPVCPGDVVAAVVSFSSMLEVADVENQLEEITAEFLDGSGVLALRGAFAPDQVDQARRIIMEESDLHASTATHFQGGNTDRLALQRRVWNLLNKGGVFVEMVQHPDVVTVCSHLLGSAFKLGSIAANRLLPGGPGQEPHIDYPYWDFHKRHEFPARMNSSFAMNLQATILLDDFTADNGATAYLPGSQTTLSYPEDRNAFDRGMQRMTGSAGDCVIFNGMIHHCAMPNRSGSDRSGVLIEYLPKFVIQLEDQINGVSPEVIAAGTPLLRQLISVDYKFPELLDEAPAGNTEGRNA